MKNKFFYTAIGLSLCFFLSISLRAGIFQNSAGGLRCPFTNVDAVHYYFTKLVAEGRVIPSVDTNIQHPEGMNIKKELSIFMEYPIGFSYRFAARFYKVVLDDYIRYFIWIFAALSIFAVFIAARAIGCSSLSGVMAAFFYSFSFASLNRTAGFGYMRENFSLPIIFFFLAFFLKSLEKKSSQLKNNVYLVLAGAFLFVALFSWQFSQFFYLIFGVFAAIALFSGKYNIVKNFLIVSVFAVIAGIAAPYLRENRFLISTPAILMYAIFITYLFAYFKKLQFSFLLALFCLSFAAIKIATFKYSTDFTNYFHVYSLLFYQFKFLGIKPPDPTLIPIDARMLWDVAHSSPNIREVFQYFGVVFLAGALPLGVILKKIFKKEAKDGEIFLVYFTVIFIILYLLANRTMVFLIFFVSILAGEFFAAFKGKILKRIAIALSIFAIIIQFSTDLKVSVYGADTGFITDLLRWIDANTKKSDVILSSPRSSPEILAYTGRPIVLHAKLETKYIRDKSYLWAETLLAGTEEDFYRLCKGWGVNYFAFPKGTYLESGPSSWRYITNNLSKGEDSLGYKFEALPRGHSESKFDRDGFLYEVNISSGFTKPKLKHFELVYQNKYFNVYKVN